MRSTYFLIIFIPNIQRRYKPNQPDGPMVITATIRDNIDWHLPDFPIDRDGEDGKPHQIGGLGRAHCAWHSFMVLPDLNETGFCHHHHNRPSEMVTLVKLEATTAKIRDGFLTPKSQIPRTRLEQTFIIQVISIWLWQRWKPSSNWRRNCSYI